MFRSVFSLRRNGQNNMIRITFVCYGNICRSPMAEFLFKDLIKEKGVSEEFSVNSAATSSEELGNPVYPPVKKILDRMGLECSRKRARKLFAADYDKADYFIAMDNRNVRDIKRIFGDDSGNKVKRLLDFAGEDKDVADPYWTGNFEEAFCDIVRGVNALYSFFKPNGKTDV